MPMKQPILERAGMDERRVADRDLGADMAVPSVPVAAWTMVPSWIFVRAPMRIGLHVAAHHDAEPDVRLLADLDIADHHGGSARGRRCAAILAA